jgi:hypothetical protein
MGKHDKILAKVFAEPVRAGIRWADLESLCKHLGATIENRRGSRVHVSLNGIGASFHRPHADKGSGPIAAAILNRSGNHAMIGHFITNAYKGYVGRAE